MNRVVITAAVLAVPFVLLAQPAAPAPRQPRGASPRMVSTQPDTLIGRSGAFLGVEVQDVTSGRVSALKLKQERGAEITMVDQDAPAGQAGLKAHDVVLSFNGTSVESVEQLRRMLRETPPGRTVSLGISRDGQPLTVSVQLGDKDQMYVNTFKVATPAVAMPFPPMKWNGPTISVLQYSRRNGLLVENLTPQLAEYFGAKGGSGILVRSVEKGSSAEGAGFKAGDVILRVGSEAVSDSADWNCLLRKNAGATITIVVLRDRKEQNLSLAIPERGAQEQGANDWFEIPVPDSFTKDPGELAAEVEAAQRAAREMQIQARKMQAERDQRLAQAMERLREIQWQHFRLGRNYL